MKRFLVLICMVVFLMGTGCENIAPNPYELTAEARKNMIPAEQESYINRIKALETLVASLNDPTVKYDDAVQKLQSFYENLPEEWNWRKNEKPEDKAWRFFMTMMDGFMGCQNYDNYADCKDAADALGKELSDCFNQANDRRRALIVSEQRFSTLYEEGKKAIERQQ